MKNYTALEIARYIISRCSGHKNPISNLQLQKILYFVQVGYLKSTGNMLFKDDFLAWQLGPVVQSVYDKYFVYGSSRIYDSYATDIDGEVRKIIDPIIDEKLFKSAWDLVNEAHVKGGPWDISYNGYKNTVIPAWLIKKHECIF